MKKNALLLFTMLLSFYTLKSHSQSTVIKLWSKDIPGGINDPEYGEKTNPPNHSSGCIAKIKDPEISVFLPPAEKNTGTAIMICPGGGYGVVCIEHEGFAVAKWLNEQGIAAIVLKYRLPADQIMKDQTIGPLQDAQEAMRITRRNAIKWKIDPAKIGVLGFSAGGHLAASLSTHYNEVVYKSTDNTSAKPDFSVLIYPVITFDSTFTHHGSRKNLIGENPSKEKIKFFSNELNISKETPPAFLIHSTDDKAVPAQNSIRYYEELKKNNIDAELHIYEKGGHGYGLATNNKGTESSWPAALGNWLKLKGLL